MDIVVVLIIVLIIVAIGAVPRFPAGVGARRSARPFARLART